MRAKVLWFDLAHHRMAMVLMLALAAVPGCSLFQKRDLTQDYASALRIYTGTATLAADAIANGLVPKDKLPMVKAASDSAYQALKLMAAAVNAKDKASFDSYMSVFSESIALINVILKGVKDAAGTTSDLGLDWKQSPGIEGRGRGCVEVARSAWAGREPDTGAVADIGGSGNGRESGARRGYCESVIDLFCGTAFGGDTDGVGEQGAPNSGRSDLIVAVLVLLNTVTGALVVIFGKQKKAAVSASEQATAILLAVAQGVKTYAENAAALRPNAEVTDTIQRAATRAGVEPQLNAMLAGAGLLANR